MTGDAQPPGDDPVDTTPAPRPRAKPSPAATAAGRARRIGGLPSSGPAADTSRSGGVGTADPNTVRPGDARGPSLRKRPGAGAGAAASTTRVAERPGRRTPPGSVGKPASAKPGTSVTVPSWFPWSAAAVFVAIAVVFAVLVVADKVGGGSGGSGPASTKQRETVLAAAKNCVAATNTYRYTDVAKYEKAGLQCATGTYAKQYRTAMDTLIKKNAPTQKFTQIAQVNSAGIESVSGDGTQWSVLVYGQLNITNSSTGKQGRIDPFAVVARMDHVKGAWLISSIKLLSTPGS